MNSYYYSRIIHKFNTYYGYFRKHKNRFFLRIIVFYAKRMTL